MVTFQIITGAAWLRDHLELHPPKGKDWEAKVELSDDPAKVDDLHALVLSPEGSEVAMVKVAPDTPMQLRSKIEMDMIPRRRGGTPPATPPAMTPRADTRRQFSGTTGDESTAKIYREITTDLWSLRISHGNQFGKTFVQVMDETGRVVAEVDVGPRGSFSDRLHARIDELCNGGSAATTTQAATPPASTPPVDKRPTVEAGQRPPAPPVEPEPQPEAPVVRMVRLDEIQLGDNIRTDMGDLDGLAALIKQNGVKQALTVRLVDGRLRLSAGERRLRAAKLAGLQWVPCTLDENADEAQTLEWMISENDDRKALNPVERAHGYQRLLKLLGSQGAVAERVHRDRVYVNEHLQLLELPIDIQHQVASGVISVRSALEFLRKTRDMKPELRQQVAAAFSQAAPAAATAPQFIDDQLRRLGVVRTTPPKQQPTPPTHPSATTGSKAGQGRPADPVPPETKPAVQSTPTPTSPSAPANPPPAASSGEAARARQLAQVGDPAWKRVTAEIGHDVISARDAYLSMSELMDHWDRRAKLGAAMMPGATGKSTVEIPEQRVQFGGTLEIDQSGVKVSLWDDEISVTLPAGSVRTTTAYNGQPVLYRVELVRTGTDRVGLLQQVVIPDGPRHIIMTGAGAAVIEAEKVATWREQIMNLPVMPIC